MIMKFLAFDLGATSGRAIIGTVENDKLTSEEVYRFPNAVKEIDGKYYWDINSLFDHFKAALKKVAGMGLKIESIGIDTWGVDFGHISKDGGIIGMPRAYRDHTPTESLRKSLGSSRGTSSTPSPESR